MDELSTLANKPAPRPGILNPRCDPENVGTLLHRRLFPSPQPPQALCIPRPLDGNSPPQGDKFINYRIRPGLSHTRSGPGHTYRGPQGPVLDGVPLGQLGTEGINNDDALSLTVFSAVTFTPDLPPTDTNPTGHRPRAHSLDSAPMLPEGVVIGCGGGSSIWALDGIFKFTGVTNHD